MTGKVCRSVEENVAGLDRQILPVRSGALTFIHTFTYTFGRGSQQMQFIQVRFPKAASRDGEEMMRFEFS